MHKYKNANKAVIDKIANVRYHFLIQRTLMRGNVGS